MGFEVYVENDFDAMSQKAAELLTGRMRDMTVTQNTQFNLGLATGNSPTGLYRIMAERQHEFNAKKVRTWNLDEYVGLPGTTPEERRQHPESYYRFMHKHLFDLLEPQFAETHIPPGTEIEQGELESALNSSPEDVVIEGADKGEAIDILLTSNNPYLHRIKTELLIQYYRGIVGAGGINYWVVGVGSEGHIAFHESGIPFRHKMFLVHLHESTIRNAVEDGHFKSTAEAPYYAMTMGAAGVAELSDHVLLLASGERKTEPVARSLLGSITPDVPISVLQMYIGNPRKYATYIIDETAAAGILRKEKALAEKGITLRDVRE